MATLRYATLRYDTIRYATPSVYPGDPSACRLTCIYSTVMSIICLIPLNFERKTRLIYYPSLQISQLKTEITSQFQVPDYIS